MHPTWTLIIVVVLAALLFMRPGKLSSLMTDLGEGIKGFRKGMSDTPPPAATTPPPAQEPPRQVVDQSAPNTNQDHVQN